MRQDYRTFALKRYNKSCFQFGNFWVPSEQLPNEKFPSCQLAIESTLFKPPERSNGSPPIYLK
jgi:hypothetical protein